MAHSSKGLVLAGAMVAILAGAPPAHALFQIDLAPGGTKFFISDANKDVVTFGGFVGGQHSGFPVTVDTTGAVDTGAGFATIKPIIDGSLTDLLFTPQDANQFGDFSFRGQLLAAGDVTVTVQDNQGDPSQTFTFTIGTANADFDRIGIEAVTGSGETIKSVDVSSAGFKEFKQIEFSSAIPELSTWAMMLIGFSGVALQIRRRRGTVAVNS
jgi:hypothetical protein